MEQIHWQGVPEDRFERVRGKLALIARSTDFVMGNHDFALWNNFRGRTGTGFRGIAVKNQHERGQGLFLFYSPPQKRGTRNPQRTSIFGEKGEFWSDISTL